MKIEKHFNLKEIGLTIMLEQPIAGHIVLPLYVGQNTSPNAINRTLIVPELDFDKDLKILIPNCLGEDWAESCITQVQVLVGSHYNKYGRIFGADLELYLAELILVMSFIGDTINQPLSTLDKEHLFKGLFDAFCKQIKISG